MNIITAQKHQELINTLKELKNIVEDMRSMSTDIILKWHNDEIECWLEFLESHEDKEELKSLEVEVGDRFFYKYNVRIEPINLDKKRLSLFEKFIHQLNDALQ
ncbi:hypothetical protein [Alkaliphilus transvaalensis]|uniref:hypothetical protein n=1 Tax=Alkaliphilus transvaalensis TaxID=114628 RepID=UPI000478BA6F|nr:hypothetical protein [Alkaliphilus transvaalensis]